MFARLVRPSVISQPSWSCTRNLSWRPRLPKLPSFKLTPDPPGNIIGTVNDAHIPPKFDISHGSYHWMYERIITVGMAPLVVFPFVAGVDYPLIDAGLCTLVLLHSRYGLQSCIIDYIPLRKFGFWHKLAMFLLNIGSFVSLYGIYIIETENNGLADLISKLWHT